MHGQFLFFCFIINKYFTRNAPEIQVYFVVK